jgi:hypothetical protein
VGEYKKRLSDCGVERDNESKKKGCIGIGIGNWCDY